MIKTLQEARDRFDKLFDQAYEILILGILNIGILETVIN